MPQYQTSGGETLTRNPAAPAVLWPGDEAYQFGTAVLTPGQSQKPTDDNVQFEAVTVDERSIAVCFAPRPTGGSPAGVEVRVFANANPGAAEIDVQIANVDADGAYTTPSGSAAYKVTTWTQEGIIWVGAADLQPLGAQFMTLLVVANPNGVSFWAKTAYV